MKIEVNEEERVKKFTPYVLIFLVVLAIVLLIYAITQVRTEGSRCMVNPLVYGVNKLSEVNAGDMFCTCSFNKPNSPLIRVNRERMEVEKVN